MSFKKILTVATTAGMLMSIMPAAVNADSSGWQKYKLGWKYYSAEDGFLRSSWKCDGGKWYYLNRRGYLITDVENYWIDGIFYSFDKDGVCLNPYDAGVYSGWIRSGYKYLDYTDEWEIYYDWYYYDPDGGMAHGWRNISGNWYYFNEEDEDDGYMYYSEADDDPAIIDGNYYWFSETGEMQTGWIFDGKNWRYARPDGSLYFEDWFFSGGKWYYFDYYGRMISGLKDVYIDGILYSFDKDGACLNPYAIEDDITPGWKSVLDYDGELTWFYVDQDLSFHEGWLYDGGKWYYLDEEYHSMYTEWHKIDGDGYYFNSNGSMAVGWCKLVDIPEYGYIIWGYAGSNGKLYVERWLQEDGKWYYFDDDGCCITDAVNYAIDGILYNFDSNGVCQNPNGESVKMTGWRKESVWGSYVWTYYGEDGEQYIEKWLCDGGKWYYFDDDGWMLESMSWEIDGYIYDFDENGVCLNPYSGRVNNQS